MRTIFNFANFIFKKNFSVYKFFYFIYKGISDKAAIKLIQESIKEGDTVVDVGANIGYYTLLFSDLAGSTGKVYAFEPDPLNFKHLQRLTKGRKNIQLFNKAVGEKTDKIKLYKSSDMNVDHQTYDIGEERTSVVEVDMVAIDDLLNKNETIDFLKVDIQGYDYFAMLGMKNAVKRSPTLKAFGEFWPYGLKKAGSSAKAYFSLLNELDLDVTIMNIPDTSTFEPYVNDKIFYTDFIGVKKTKVAASI